MANDDDRVKWLTAAPMLAIHALCLAAFWAPFSWWYVAVAVGLYGARMFALTTAYHRYFSHRAYKTSRVFQFILAWAACTCAQKGPLWWAANHRNHHKHSDQPEDLHSPVQRGFWWSHMGWILSDKHKATDWDKIQDFAKYPELRWLNRYHLVPSAVLALTLAAVGGWPLFIWGFCISTTVLWHGTFTINSLSHLFGSRRYQTKDDSRNNWLLALITLGEGWHNNHHHYMSTANQGFFWWEIDLSYYGLLAFEKLGLVWDLRVPPAHILQPTCEPTPAREGFAAVTSRRR